MVLARLRSVAYAALAAILVLTVPSLPAAAAPDTFVREKCWLPPLKQTTVWCGRLHVGDPVTATLPVVVVQHDPAAPSETAILYLQGGPGGDTGLNRYEFRWHEWARRTGITQDLVLFDQRGTGLAEPSLICDEVRDAARKGLVLGWYSEQSIDLNARATAECHRRLVAEGQDLTQYSTRRNAADVIALMESLPYAQWTLLGTSYGTRLALEVMRMQPEGIRSAVLDGVVPPGIDWRAEEPALIDDAIAKIDRACSWWQIQSPTCHNQADDFLGSLDRLLAELAETPRTVSTDDWQTGQSLDVRVDAPALLDALGSALALQDGANLARDAVVQAASGQFTVLDGILESWASGALSNTVHEPVFLSVWCDLGGDSFEEVRGRRVSDSHFYGAHFPRPSHFSPCAYWTSSRAPPASREPVRSSIPALVLSGEYDSITPAEWGDRVAGELENSVHFVMPRGGHVAILHDPCAMAILRAFLADPETEPDSQCLGNKMPGIRHRQ